MSVSSARYNRRMIGHISVAFDIALLIVVSLFADQVRLVHRNTTVIVKVRRHRLMVMAVIADAVIVIIVVMQQPAVVTLGRAEHMGRMGACLVVHFLTKAVE